MAFLEAASLLGVAFFYKLFLENVCIFKIRCIFAKQLNAKTLKRYEKSKQKMV